ncbi:MAG: 23S rRNA (adenine(2503)-C(2))-methyltransferase RlmN [Myxococcales bacterium]|nr:23S rRNA (adenine(2503)-C(2))-methyltransferase RlmN [Myxococcales bacterium]
MRPTRLPSRSPGSSEGPRSSADRVSIRPNPPERSLTELSRQGLRDLLLSWGEPRYRADQLYRWLFQRGVRDVEQMTDLSKSLRRHLRENEYTIGRVTLEKVRESIDGTRKLQFRLADGAAIESVLIPMPGGLFTQCLSSQVGCAMDCQFCYTGTLGLSRHLTSGEMIDQVVRAADGLPPGSRIDHIVYMGMGEPLHNFDAVVASLGVICDPDGCGYSHKRVTISTSGLVPQIDKLGRVAPVNLAISLNASNDEVRNQIMPVNKRWNIDALIEAVRRYPLPPRRKLTFEYVLLGGVNDTDDDARRLVKLLVGLPARINIIPWNPFEGTRFLRPADERVRSFQRILLDRGLTATVRVTKGLDIDAACGQLGERPSA